MRWFLACLVLALLAAGAFAPARGDDGPAVQDQLNQLETRLARAELLVDYLLSREAALTAWALADAERSTALLQDLGVARQQGFTMGAISSTSREALLAGLERLARGMGADLPEPTKEQKDALARARR